MQIRWTRLPFQARNQEEFNHGLTEWLSWVFYDELPNLGYEVREEQIYTAFRIAEALTHGKTLMAEAGPGTGKTFAYLLPAVCYARFKGAPVVVASGSPVLQAQLANPEGDIPTISRLLKLDIDARVARDPSEYVCEVKVSRGEPLTLPEGWDTFRRWAERSGTGARSEVPDVPDELWEHLAWDPALACDTCTLRGHCHVMAARRHYREAPDLIVCDHRLFSRDLLTRAERQESGEMPLLPAYAAAVLDEGHHLPETWQRAQGFSLTRPRLSSTLERIGDLVDRSGPVRALQAAKRQARQLFQVVDAATEPGEGKRHIVRDEQVLEATTELDRRMDALQEELVTEEAMHEGLDLELDLRAYQARIDEIRAALDLFRSDEAVVWSEGADLWMVPRRPVSLFGAGRLAPGLPLIFSSATMEPAYQARVLRLNQFESSKVGVPFDLSEQALIYQPERSGDPIMQAVEVIRAAKGRTLVLLNSLAEVRRYKEALASIDLPFPLLFEGEGDRGAQLERFRQELPSVLFGATFWEGVDVPGEALSCCIIPALPFPEHDPLIQERRAQAEAAGDDPFEAVDLPEMLIKLKQGAGRLIRTAQDRGVLALLDRTHLTNPWAKAVVGALPEDAEQTSDIEALAAFIGA